VILIAPRRDAFKTPHQYRWRDERLLYQLFFFVLFHHEKSRAGFPARLDDWAFQYRSNWGNFTSRLS